MAAKTDLLEITPREGKAGGKIPAKARVIGWRSWGEAEGVIYQYDTATRAEHLESQEIDVFFVVRGGATPARARYIGSTSDKRFLVFVGQGS